ncbi:histidine phosphatase family protein [Nocardioides sp. 616]|uniref:histidine phosphatase family protein n=1 Tax=Nocardioides sp. 616 TaxID=2268090 RepID=UPI000CE358FD|nr:histidine phosphatase family protein [Nocardioides sp. 616]
MATLILVRHGRTTANASGTLAGRLPGVLLDEVGREQVAATAARLAAVPLAALVSSPLERCRETARAIASAQQHKSRIQTEKRLTECDYGSWQGGTLKELAKEELWKTVQQQPSAARFPGGESLREMSDRAVAAVRQRDAAIEAEHGPGAVWAAVSHGDVIKSILADAVGSHLDQFQRIVVDPASVSIVRFTSARPFVVTSNSHAGDLSWLAPPLPEGGAADDAAVGGGAGPTPAGPPS